ncbi:MAG: PTS sugar transporter subunit IIA [Desulfamplus sp.]|nr:PTS sugar transporter subunit IIA [Desulfamplus sp.]MBF0412276.1 PTS sugar transporter subunit IIA [Desulfamplus sp.]
MRRALTEIADDLGLNLDTLERWIRQGKIPVNKHGSIGIYNELEFHRWAEKHRKTQMHPNNDHALQKEQDDQSENILSPSVLLSALKRGGVFHNIVGKTKDEVIDAVIDIIPDFSGKDRDEIRHQLMEREKLASTGIGKGVAIPHPRNPLANGLTNPMIITCFLENSVDFDAIDDKPVSVLFVILSPSVETHLNLLSRLSFCLRDSNFMAFLHQKPDADLFLNRIKDMERDIDRREM